MVWSKGSRPGLGGSETYGKVAGLAAVVAAAVGTTVQTQGGTVSLDVAETLAVVALLGWMVLASWNGGS